MPSPSRCSWAADGSTELRGPSQGQPQGHPTLSQKPTGCPLTAGMTLTIWGALLASSPTALPGALAGVSAEGSGHVRTRPPAPEPAGTCSDPEGYGSRGHLAAQGEPDQPHRATPSQPSQTQGPGSSTGACRQAGREAPRRPAHWALSHQPRHPAQWWPHSAPRAGGSRVSLPLWIPTSGLHSCECVCMQGGGPPHGSMPVFGQYHVNVCAFPSVSTYLSTPACRCMQADLLQLRAGGKKGRAGPRHLVTLGCFVIKSVIPPGGYSACAQLPFPTLPENPRLHSTLLGAADILWGPGDRTPCPWPACRVRTCPRDRTSPRPPSLVSIHPYCSLQGARSRPEKGGGAREGGLGM